MRTGERFARRRNECRRSSSFTATRAKDLTSIGSRDNESSDSCQLRGTTAVDTTSAIQRHWFAADSDKIKTLSGNAPRRAFALYLWLGLCSELAGRINRRHDQLDKSGERASKRSKRNRSAIRPAILGRPEVAANSYRKTRRNLYQFVT